MPWLFFSDQADIPEHFYLAVDDEDRLLHPLGQLADAYGLGIIAKQKLEDLHPCFGTEQVIQDIL